MSDPTGAVLVVATGLYLANCLLGVLVALRVVDTSAVHWVHHALYGLVVAAAVVAASSALWGRGPAGWLLLPALVLLAVLPRVRAPSRGHVGLALAAAPFYALALGASWLSSS